MESSCFWRVPFLCGYFLRQIFMVQISTNMVQMSWIMDKMVFSIRCLFFVMFFGGYIFSLLERNENGIDLILLPYSCAALGIL